MEGYVSGYNLQKQWDKLALTGCLESYLIDRNVITLKALPCYVL